MARLADILIDVNAAVGADVDAAVAASAGLRLIGWAARETAGAAAHAKIVHGATGAAGTLVVPISLAANSCATGWYGSEGVPMANGISIDWIDGGLDVTLFYRLLT